MVVPMVILAVLAAIGGYVGLPEVLRLGNAINEFLGPVFADSRIAHPPGGGVTTEVSLVGAAVLALAVGFFAAYWLYVRKWGLAARLTKSARWLYDILYNKYYVDEAYTEAIVKPLRMLADLLTTTVEVQGIDGAVNGLARLVDLAGEGLRRLQSGLVRNYALATLVGVVAILAYLALRGILRW
jgi:NADH-quinone oxidoreductase subunit L